jgi:hypothetical protein
MKSIKVSELTGAALDWAVAKCEGMADDMLNDFDEYGWAYSDSRRYLTDWSQGGPIIERERIGLDQFPNSPCRAYIGTPVKYEHAMWAPEGDPLLAAMRCYVASKMGDTIEVPEELL